MKNIMMGQIYLKRMPESIYVSNEVDFDNLEIVNENIYSEESKPIIDYSLIAGCLSFWQAFSVKNGIALVERSLIPINQLTLYFTDEEEMDKDFISLTEYLAKAKFIGRRWRIPETDKNAVFLNSLGERTVLYEYENISLVHNNHTELGSMFEIMVRDPESFEPNDCICEINEEAEEYKDKANAYHKVLKYISKNRTKGF